MRRVGLLVLVPACFTIPDYDGPLGPAAADEDNDGIPNAQDFCPHIDNGTGAQVDSDSDGVGNLCDPDPAMQDVSAFYGFDGQTVGDLVSTGLVAPNDSYVEIGALGTDAYNGLTIPRTWSSVQVDMRFFAKDGVDSAGGGIGARVGRYDSDDTHGGFCTFDIEGNNGVRLTATYRSPTMTTTDTTGVVATTPYKGTLGRMRATIAGTQLMCVVDQLSRPQGDEYPSLILALTLPEAAPPGDAGIFATNAILDVEFLFAAGLP